MVEGKSVLQELEGSWFPNKDICNDSLQTYVGLPSGEDMAPESGPEGTRGVWFCSFWPRRCGGDGAISCFYTDKHVKRRSVGFGVR